MAQELFHVITKDNLEEAEKLISDILELQKPLLRGRDETGSQSGFLISRFSREELVNTISAGGEIHSLFHGDALVGYILTTGIHEFTDLLLNYPGAKFVANFDFVLEGIPTYLYQIAVAQSAQGQGLGRKMLNRLIVQKKNAILTDILVDPIKNQASLTFFKSNGFKLAGILTLPDYRDFGKLESEVLLWTPDAI